MKQIQLPGIRRLIRRVSRQRKSPKKLRHVSYEVHRCRTGLVERIFAETWMRWNNRFDPILDCLMPRGLILSEREARIVATVIQWLGTNVGTGFLHECLNRAGESIVQNPNRPDNSYYSGHEDGLYKNVKPSAWFNLAIKKAISQRFAPVSEMSIRRDSFKFGHGRCAAALARRTDARMQLRQDRIVRRLGIEPDFRYQSQDEPSEKQLASMTLEAIWRDHV